ncbi:MAG: hypothetical protein AB1689_06205 [Thermodesulfobacteriota bacterium]
MRLWKRCSARAEPAARALAAKAAIARRLARGAGVAAAAAVALWAAGCTSDDPARAAAERFVDHYYVEIDLPKAREQAVGLAREKVERSMKLLEGMEPAEEAVRPRVHYRFLEQQDSSRDRRGFLYELTITFDGGEQAQRRALVTVREDGGVWHAANFQEFE